MSKVNTEHYRNRVKQIRDLVKTSLPPEAEPREEFVLLAFSVTVPVGDLEKLLDAYERLQGLLE